MSLITNDPPVADEASATRLNTLAKRSRVLPGSLPVIRGRMNRTCGRRTNECTAYSQVNSVSWVVLLGQRKSTLRRSSRRRRREVIDVITDPLLSEECSRVGATSRRPTVGIALAH